ncbi:hypothetical protein CQA48_30580, partial [Klebsiella pneumoniae]
RPQTGTSFAIIERATKAFNQINEARVIASSRRLKDWDQRPQTGTSFAIIERATKAFNQINEARVIASSRR